MNKPSAKNSPNILGDFQRRRLSLPLKRLLDNGLEALSRLKQERYHVPASLFGSYIEAAQRHGITSVYAGNSTRPSHHSLIALLEHTNEVLLPEALPKDFLRVVEILQLTELLDIVVLHALGYKSYGVYNKQCLPVRILTQEDARRCGFELVDALAQSIAEMTSLWWQKWGGVLYSFTFNPRTNPPVIESKNLKVGVGKYECLPFWLVR